MTKAIIYVRFSQCLGAEPCPSLYVQEARCRAYAGTCGYEVVDVLREPDASGAHGDNDPSPEAWYTARPKLYQAVQSLTPGMLLLVTKMDRIGLSAHGQGILRLDVARHGCRIETADEFDPEAPEDHMMQTMLSGVAEYERMLVVARARAASPCRRAPGRRRSRLDKIPYGFQADPTDPALIVPNPSEQETIAAAIAYRAANPDATPYAVGRHLDSIGRFRREGKSWHNAHRLLAKILGGGYS